MFIQLCEKESTPSFKSMVLSRPNKHHLGLIMSYKVVKLTSGKKKPKKNPHHIRDSNVSVFIC